MPLLYSALWCWRVRLDFFALSCAVTFEEDTPPHTQHAHATRTHPFCPCVFQKASERDTHTYTQPRLFRIEFNLAGLEFCVSKYKCYCSFVARYAQHDYTTLGQTRLSALQAFKRSSANKQNKDEAIDDTSRMLG